MGGKAERILPFFFIMNYEIHCSHSLFFFAVSSRSSAHRHWQPFCNWVQMYRGGSRGRASGFIGVRDWVKLAAASSAKSRRSYGKNRGCEQSKF